MSKPNPRRSEAARRGWETRRRRAQEKDTIERAATLPNHFFAGNESRLGISTEQSSQAVLLRNFKGWSAIATNAIANEVMSLKPFVGVKRMRPNGVIQVDRIDSHPLTELLQNPSPNFSRLNLQRLLALWIAQVGEAYLLKITDELGITRQLEPLNPRDIDLLVQGTGISGYVYRSPHTGQEIEYTAQEIVRIYEPDPEFPFQAKGKLSAQSLAYDASLFLDETLRKHFQNDATPKVAIRAGDDTELMSPEDKKRWDTEWANAYNRRRGSAVGVPSLLPPGYDIHEFSIWNGKEFLPILEHYRDQILAAYGVPGSIVGLVQDVNRAAAETNMFVFESTTIRPMADLIADALTRQLARDFDSSLVITFEDFITTDKTFELEKRTALLEKKVITINEVRIDEGHAPVEWGDLPVGQQQDTPYDGSKPEPAPLPEQGPPAPVEEDKGDDLQARRLTKEKKQNE